jgi:hypothetical protein
MIYQPFVYIWTYLPTGHWYIGSRTAYGCHPKDGYISSSDIVIEGVSLSPDDWKREILDTGSVQQMLDLELFLLEQLNARDDMLSLNQTNGKDGKIVFKEKPWKIPQKDTVLEAFYLKKINNNVERGNYTNKENNNGSRN